MNKTYLLSGDACLMNHSKNANTGGDVYNPEKLVNYALRDI